MVEPDGRACFPDADRLLITADAGGSNGFRLRAWKVELARLATTTDTGLTVHAAYDPEWYPKGVKISNRELAAVPLSTSSVVATNVTLS